MSRLRCVSRVAAFVVFALLATDLPSIAIASCIWNQVYVPADLISISAIGPSDIWADGDGPVFGTVLHHWNGAQWTSLQVPLPTQDAYSRSISAVADDDIWAAGSYTNNVGEVQPYAIHWNGRRWVLTTLALETRTAGISNPIRAFAPNDVWAVGNFGSYYFSEHWDGARWKTVYFASLPGAEIDALDGTSSNDLWAAGRRPYSRSIIPLIEHFNGTRWKIVNAPAINTAQLYGLHAQSPTDAWGVGYYYDASPKHPARTFIEHWDGASWTVVPSPNFDWPSRELVNQLGAVGASSTDDAWAVGSVGGVGLLAMHWDGTAWTIPERPPALGPGGFASVVDLSPHDAWAVGGTVADSWCFATP